MIYFFYGQNDKKEKAVASARESLLKKYPGANVFIVPEEEWNKERIEELTLSQGLFGDQHIIVSKNILRNEEIFENIKENIKAIKESPNIFIFNEDDVTKKISGVIEKYAEKVEVFEEKNPKKAERFNMFALTDALGARDKKRSWILLTKAFDGGMETEEAHGMIFWQIKSLILASKSQNAIDAGLQPFVFSKSKGYSKNFKDGELEKISSNLISMYHNAHRGKHDFKLALERFVLSL